jgi:hypothetical protein
MVWVMENGLIKGRGLEAANCLPGARPFDCAQNSRKLLLPVEDHTSQNESVDELLACDRNLREIPRAELGNAFRLIITEDYS